jgi:hypothetical protein
MNKIDDGGPIAPNMVTRTAEGVSSVIEAQGGMTLRDHFAAAALQGILAYYIDVSPAKVAKVSYEYADAMLAARKEGA